MLRSRPHESRYFWTAYFGLLSSRIRWKWSPKKASFQKRSPKWRKKNAGRQLVYLRMDRYGDLINQFTSYTTVLALHMLYKGCCGVFSITWAVSCRQRIDVDGRKRFEYATFGRVFLWNGIGGKNLRFQKVFGQVWTGSHWQQTQSYTRRICPFHFFNFFFEFENNKKFQWANQTAVRVCAIIMNPLLISFADL